MDTRLRKINVVDFRPNRGNPVWIVCDPAAGMRQRLLAAGFKSDGTYALVRPITDSEKTSKDEFLKTIEEFKALGLTLDKSIQELI